MSEPEMIEAVANVIRTVDGSHDLGAGALAEAIVNFAPTAGYAVIKVGEVPPWMDDASELDINLVAALDLYVLRGDL